MNEFASTSRMEIDNLLISKLPDVLNDKQKRTRVKNFLFEMSRKDKTIRNVGAHTRPKWVLKKTS